jgi:TM2 domain-containing membrane protein YozV
MKSLLALTVLWACSAVCGQTPSRTIQRDLSHDLPGIGSLTLSAVTPHQGDLLAQAGPGGRKSPALAVLYSLLLPGMGELYTGEYGSGKYFTMVEGALVVTLISVDRYANWLKDDSRQFAVIHARTTAEGKGDQYFSDIGDFQSVYDFNEAILRDRKPEKVYDPNSSFYWSWDSPANREQYRSIRVRSDDRFNDTRFIVAAMAVNHIISAINAARLVFRHNRNVEEGGLIDLHADVIGGVAHPSGIRLTLSRNF